MKKSLIALLLLALVIAVSVFAVSAEKVNPFYGKTTEIVTARCEGCNADVQWSPLGTNLTAALGSGHWYLTNNTNTSAHTGFSSGTICMELNGFTYHRSNSGHPFGLTGANAKLNIQDSSVGETGKITTIGGPVYCITMSKGTANMYSGTLTRTAVGSASSNAANGSQGGAVNVTGGTFTMYGGKISGSSGNRGGGIYVSGSAAKVVIDGGVIENCFAHNRAGGIFVGSSATLEFKSGAVRNCYVASSYTTPFGGNIYVENAKALISGGTIENGGVRATGVTYGGNYAASTGTWGGNICVRGASGTATISGSALIQNGTALRGGNICNENGIVNVQGGQIKNGTATANKDQAGGNIAFSGTANVTISGGTISGGTIPNATTAIGGGSICGVAGNLSISGGTISGGNAAGSLGGNIFWNSSGTLSISGGTISGGNAATGGNIYLEANRSMTMSGGTITTGVATGNGGNIYTAGSNTVNIDAADGKTVTITKGKAAQGGNIRNYASTVNVTGPNVTISGGTGTGPDIRTVCSRNKDTGAVVAYAVLNLTDVTMKGAGTHGTTVSVGPGSQINLDGKTDIDCVKIEGETLDDGSTTVATNSTVTIKTGFNGTAQVAWTNVNGYSTVFDGNTVHPSLWQEAGYKGTGNVYAIDGSNTSKILIDDGDAIAADAANGIKADSKFVVAAFAGVDVAADGELILTPIGSLKDAADYDFIRPYSNAPITLVDDLTLDLNNATVHITTGEHKLNLIEMRTDSFDDAGDAKDGYVRGYVTVDKEENVNTVVCEKATGNQYIVVPTGETADGLTKFTAHRVQVDIDSVNIKPGSMALYYTTNMDTTPTASKFALSYGVVLSLVDMPGANFKNDDSNEDGLIDNLYTEIDFYLAEDERVQVRGANSALLRGILNQGAPGGQNKEWGEMPICANAYVSFDINGEEVCIMADKTYKLSLLDIMKLVDETVDPSSETIFNMYKTWADPLAIWGEEGKLPNMYATYGA